MMRIDDRKCLVEDYKNWCALAQKEESLLGLISYLDESGLFKGRRQTIKEIWDLLKDYAWNDSLKTLFMHNYDIKEKTKEEEFKEKIAEEIIEKVDDMVGGKMIAQALREMYLEEDT